ncbi:MAG TPA: hypothetical protein VK735_38620 [Pseudonocardia sp.]|jgi:hypothetical protein|uniref:hypothetical protein n=1 Tax=Pseudonocardia sp. TaxID=60912 RepID=UPI002C314DCB|nr:hypothetical protein [Pseudonocardia sp.]HTF53397.1 hypothetical protein [Pseudonocardia sp.]
MTNAEQTPAAAPASEVSRATDVGGDPVCWLHLVCPECGRLASAEDEPRSGGHGGCPECGAELSG